MTSSKQTQAALPSLLEAYIRDLLARAMGTSPARIDTPAVSAQSRPRFPHRRRGAKPHQYRARRERSACEIHAKREQHQCIGCLHVAERMLEGTRPDHSKASGNGMIAGAQSSPPLSGADAADLLERIDELSEEEVDRHLSVLASEGRP